MTKAFIKTTDRKFDVSHTWRVAYTAWPLQNADQFVLGIKQPELGLPRGTHLLHVADDLPHGSLDGHLMGAAVPWAGTARIHGTDLKIPDNPNHLLVVAGGHVHDEATVRAAALSLHTASLCGEGGGQKLLCTVALRKHAVARLEVTL